MASAPLLTKQKEKLKTVAQLAKGGANRVSPPPPQSLHLTLA